MNHHIFPARRNISPIKNANETFFEACLFALQKKGEKNHFQKWESCRKTHPSVLHPSETFGNQDCVCQELQWKIVATKKKSCITFRLHLFIHHHVQILVVIMKRQSPGGISCSASKDKSNPNREAYILKRPLFRQLCWAACYTHKISQPLRITRSSQNNHCSTMCWTHFEQGSPRHNRDAAR